MAKKLVLINPSSPDRLNAASIGIYLTFPAPSLAYLAALTPPDWEVQVLDENVEPITFEPADLVGITSMTSNVTRAYEISEQYRRMGITTVMGGIHTSMVPDEAIRFCDVAVVGEAESVWQGLLSDFESNKLKRVYWGERGSVENLPRPRTDLYSDRYRIRAVVQTARGCPMDCEFCSVTEFNGRTYRLRPVEEVLAELETLDSKELLLSDDNILSHGKEGEERAIRLFRGMKERGLNKRWVSQAGIDFGNSPEVLKWAQKSGCYAVMIGFESINEETLKGMRKSRNLKIGVAGYGEIIKRIQAHGIGVYGQFVLGSDGDRKDVFQRTIDFVLGSKMDTASYTIATPLPGTRLFKRLEQEGRLLRTNFPDDWEIYDYAHAVFRPMHMAPEELEDGVYEVYQQTTSRVTSLKRAVNSLWRTRNLPVTLIAYSLNRGFGSLATSKWELGRGPSAPPASGQRPTLSTVEEAGSEAELIGTAQSSGGAVEQGSRSHSARGH